MKADYGSPHSLQEFNNKINALEEITLIQRANTSETSENGLTAENDKVSQLLTPEVIFAKDDLAFEREIKALSKKEFMEFRKRFREFSSDFCPHPFENDKANLRTISKKLHLVKREHEKREAIDRIQLKIKEMLGSPEEALQMDELDFKEAIHYMENKEFRAYASEFKKLYYSALDDRQANANGAHNIIIDKHQRKLIKKWDLIEEEMIDRQKRTRTVLTD